MRKVINKTYIHYENKNSKRAIVFIPGGPGITGEYLDTYIENYFLEKSDASVYRFLLPNHENLYGSENGLNFDDASELLASRINGLGIETPISFVGHSYGALVLLNMLHKKILKSLIGNLILVGMPKDLSFSKEFQEKKRLINSQIQPNSDETFISYFHSIAPLYFLKNSSNHIIQFDIGYWLNNKEMGISDPELLRKILEENYLQKIIEINGEFDTLIDHAKTIKTFSSSTDVISGSGHFPMIEQPINFTDSLLKFLSE
jgi:pimeloyl-ACP methyl ester carboxylesterase